MGIKKEILTKNTSSIPERIVTLGKKWFNKAVSSNPDIRSFIKNTAFNSSNTPFVFHN